MGCDDKGVPMWVVVALSIAKGDPEGDCACFVLFDVRVEDGDGDAWRCGCCDVVRGD